MSKKVDVSFMKFVTKEEDWQREVIDAGEKFLCIVDVYTAIWGPCEMLAQNFNNYYFDLGEKYGMKFVRAVADNIKDLKEFRENPTPNFLFYLNGEKVDSVQGADIPKILQTIKTKSPAIEE